MLILTRRVGETLIINDDIRITVLEIRGNQIRLGTDAPRNIGIYREEVYNRMQRAGKEGKRGAAVHGRQFNR